MPQRLKLLFEKKEQKIKKDLGQQKQHGVRPAYEREFIQNIYLKKNMISNDNRI